MLKNIGKNLITIDKSSYKNGCIIGRYTRKYLIQRIKTVRSIIKKTDYSENLLSSRIRDFVSLLKKVAPSWLNEAKGIADSAGINVGEILMLNCLPLDIYQKGGMNCTSFMRIGEKENLLFKIRDERNWPQHFVIKKNEGTTRFQSSTDIGNLGIAYFFNESYVTGANNTGSESKNISDEPRLSDCHILRLFAEQCRTVDDAPALLGKLIRAKAIGGAGLDRGIIFPLVDREKGMILECTSEDYTSNIIRNGPYSVTNHFLSLRAKQWERKNPNKNTLTRKKRIDDLLGKSGKALALKDIIRFSRDRKSLPCALCNDNNRHFWMTLSADIQIIDRHRPERSYKLFCCGNTRNSFFVPFHATEKRSFIPLLSGDFYNSADTLYRMFCCGAHMHREQRILEKDILESVENGDFSLEFAQKAFHTLKRCANSK